jgi:SAM-dependent methyltransferase
LGLDLSLGMLRAGDLAGAQAAQADLQALPLRASTLDRVYALTSFLVTPREGLGGFLEVARTLRPRGTFVLTLLESDCWAGLAGDLAASGLSPEREFFAGQDRGWVCRATGGA